MKVSTGFISTSSMIGLIFTISACCPKVIPTVEHKTDTLIVAIHDTFQITTPAIEYELDFNAICDSLIKGVHTETYISPNQYTESHLLHIDTKHNKITCPPVDTAFILQYYQKTVIDSTKTTIPVPEKYIPTMWKVFGWAGWIVALVLGLLIALLFRIKN